MRVLLCGPPGAGKGTQAALLAERFGVAHVASGNLLREAIASGSPVGAKAKAYVDRGELVPDEVVIEIVMERLGRPDAESFILDGFPRNAAQAEALDDYLSRAGRPLDVVIALEVPDEEIVRRLSGRRICPACQRSYHVTDDPPARDEVCDEDGTPLQARSDDTPQTVRRRLEVYRSATAGLLEHYRALAVRLDGVGGVEDVHERIVEAIKART